MRNGEAIGYGLLALKSLGYSKEELKKFEDEFNYQLGTKTEEEAYRFYMKYEDEK
jgi:Holliday junction resolvasome RuvABC DNA-binding subunit